MSTGPFAATANVGQDAHAPKALNERCVWSDCNALLLRMYGLVDFFFLHWNTQRTFLPCKSLGSKVCCNLSCTPGQGLMDAFLLGNVTQAGLS
jgi:hypothetical protein